MRILLIIFELCFRFPPILSEFKWKPVEFLIILAGTEVSWLNLLKTGNEFGDDPLHKRSSSFLFVPYSNRGSRKSQITLLLPLPPSPPSKKKKKSEIQIWKMLSSWQKSQFFDGAIFLSLWWIPGLNLLAMRYFR